MDTKMCDMPNLQAEDDGFLLQLKMSVIDKHIETLGIESYATIDECVRKILADSVSSTDVGGSLPLYIPWRDDDGIIQGSFARPVWAGEHIEVPLYGNIDPEGVERLIVGNRLGASSLYEGFMLYSPAFRVALLVHHICQIVLIHPMAAEAFVLGRYNELPFDDRHFEKFDVPSTELVRIESYSGLRTEWVAKDAHSLRGFHRVESRINGWNVRVRGSQPKESLMVEAWQDIRSKLDAPRDVPYTHDGVRMRSQDAAPSGRSRKRVGDHDVDLMFDWVSEGLKAGTFPMRGRMKDWKKAVTLIEANYPYLVGRWTPDSMRKAYERRIRRGY